MTVSREVVGVALKVAVQVVAVLIATVTGFVVAVLHSFVPVQPVKIEPVSSIAVMVNT
ncbi:MAG: hypothetical protein R3E08_02415 [Thiotrichaceae bacterium]